MHKTFRPFLLLAIAGLALASPQFEREAARPARGEIAALRDRLALTAEQQIQFRSLLRDRKAAIDSDATLPPKERRQRLRAVRAQTDAKMRAALNDNQRVEFDQLLRERRDRAEVKRQTALPPL